MVAPVPFSIEMARTHDLWSSMNTCSSPAALATVKIPLSGAARRGVGPTCSTIELQCVDRGICGFLAWGPSPASWAYPRPLRLNIS
jgi:hypothetical protein